MLSMNVLFEASIYSCITNSNCLCQSKNQFGKMDWSSQCDNGYEYRYNPLLTNTVISTLSVQADLVSHLHVTAAKLLSKTKEESSSSHCPEDLQFSGCTQKPTCRHPSPQG